MSEKLKTYTIEFTETETSERDYEAHSREEAEEMALNDLETDISWIFHNADSSVDFRCIDDPDEATGVSDDNEVFASIVWTRRDIKDLFLQHGIAFDEDLADEVMRRAAKVLTDCSYGWDILSDTLTIVQSEKKSA